jgi:ElaB/YqjD/DUF883 family membrane-anchored ribosome-binding protein
MEQSNFTTDGGTPTSTQGQVQANTASNDGAQGMTDRARDIAGTAQEKLADVGSTVRDRAGNLKNTVADALDSGAEKLRARGSSSASTQLATTAGATTAVATDDRVAQVSNRVADGMGATADWLRDADLDGLKTGIEQQVKDHPGRTLLIAAGLGYLLGKAFKH